MEGRDALKQQFEVLGVVREEALAAAQQRNQLIVTAGEDALLHLLHRLSHLNDLCLRCVECGYLGGELAGHGVVPDQLLLLLLLLQEALIVGEALADLAQVTVLAGDAQE